MSGNRSGIWLVMLGWWSMCLGSAADLLHVEWNRDAIEILAGREEWLDRSTVPASTFKPVHALAAVRSGLPVRKPLWWTDETRILGAPRHLHLQQAMRASSNQVFVELASHLGPVCLKNAISIWWPEVSIPADWPRGGRAATIHGAGIQISPRQQLQAWIRFRNRALGLTDPQQTELEWILEHQRHQGYRLLAKSGAYGGWLWLVGFIIEPQGQRGPIILMNSTYPVPHWQEGRARLVELFNRRLPPKSGLAFR